MKEPTAILILTRSPFSEAARGFFRLLNLIAKRASGVKVYLFYDGVLAAKKGNRMEAEVRDLAQKGVKVIVDGREFKARGLGEMSEGLEVLEHPISELVDDIMLENSRTIVV